MFRGDSRAKVLHRKLDLVLVLPRSYQNSLARSGVLQRILDQVAKDLIHRVRIGHHERVRGAGAFKLNPRVYHHASQ